MYLLIMATISFPFFLGHRVNAQTNSESPCPHLFLYEGICDEPNKWYGVVILSSDKDLDGIRLRLIFDKPSIQLGNWFSVVETDDNKEYLIKHPTFYLKANVSQIIRFYIKYSPLQPAPKLLSFQINEKTVCPEKVPHNLLTNETNASVLQIMLDSSEDKPTEQPSDDICGTVIQHSSKDVGTELTREGAFPWHAALYLIRTVNLAYLCGGSLVSEYHVLTVAHCVALKKSHKPLDQNNLVVYLGKHYLRKFSSPAVQYQSVSNIIIHPQYNPQSLDNDIAVLKFVLPIRISDYVRPICLWKDSPDLSSVLNRLGRVVGHGFDETGIVTEPLTQAEMAVVSKDTCISSYPDFAQFTSDSTYCARFKNDTSVCTGDSGGEMIFPTSDSTGKMLRWQLRGLVSISATLQSQRKCDISFYALFTDFAKYLDWIRESLK